MKAFLAILFLLTWKEIVPDPNGRFQSRVMSRNEFYDCRKEAEARAMQVGPCNHMSEGCFDLRIYEVRDGKEGGS